MWPQIDVEPLKHMEKWNFLQVGQFAQTYSNAQQGKAYQEESKCMWQRQQIQITNRDFCATIKSSTAAFETFRNESLTSYYAYIENSTRPIVPNAQDTIRVHMLAARGTHPTPHLNNQPLKNHKQCHGQWSTPPTICWQYDLPGITELINEMDGNIQFLNSKSSEPSLQPT